MVTSRCQKVFSVLHLKSLLGEPPLRLHNVFYAFYYFVSILFERQPENSVWTYFPHANSCLGWMAPKPWASNLISKAGGKGPSAWCILLLKDTHYRKLDPNPIYLISNQTLPYGLEASQQTTYTWLFAFINIVIWDKIHTCSYLGLAQGHSRFGHCLQGWYPHGNNPRPGYSTFETSP